MASMNENIMVKAILAATNLNELQNTIANNEAMPIDAKLAYQQANSGKLGNEAKALAAIFTHIASLYEQTGKLAGVSTIYNVLDARQVRGVKFTKKLAYNLQGSKQLAQFVALTASVRRNDNSRIITSVNGVKFTQNRNGYETQAMNSKGKQVTIRKAQASNDMQAIRNGIATSITDKPKGKKATSFWAIVGKVIERNDIMNKNQLALPQA